MKNYIIVAVFIIFLAVTVFFVKNKKVEYPETHQVLNTEYDDKKNSIEETDMNLYVYDDTYKLSMYEPKTGCYLGAYVLGNSSLNYDILEFEKSIGKKQAISIYNLTLGNSFPKDWVLECIANMKTPFIAVYPNKGMIFNENFLYDVAKSFGELSVPIFVEFYPDPEKYNVLPDEYKKFYIKAKETFKTYSPNSAFIWSSSINNVYSNEVYYPGDKYTDWVGINIYEPIYKNENKSDNNIWSAFDFFYDTHQKSKPIMITQFGVSHYSKKDHSYYIEDAINNINDFYIKIKEKYPRVKGINYMDFNGNENYKISDNETILNSYKTIISDEYFKYNLETYKDEFNTQAFKSAFSICKSDDTLYISNRALEYELFINVPTNNQDSILYKNMTWYPLKIIDTYKKYNIDIKNKNIYLNKL